MVRKGINGRAKGAAGEREFAKWLQDNLKLDFLPTRNLEQTREGGADILGVDPFVFEVKRCETLALRDWWIQVNKACHYLDDEPIVAYRKNHQPWRFLISARNIGLEKGFVQLEEFEAKTWLLKQLAKASA